jgi:tetratricopeptide (TPR) repeat protein
MDAQTLYRQGVIAIRDQRNLKRGHALLKQSLQQNPHNDMAWLWLTRTVRNPQTRLAYVERALRINPANQEAQKLKERLLAQTSPETSPQQTPSGEVVPPFIIEDKAPVISPLETATPQVPQVVPQPAAVSEIAVKTVDVPVTQAEKKQIMQIMDRAEAYREAGETEAAIEQWIKVLAIRVDHEEALAKASGHLWRLHYQEDARELIRRAIRAGTSIPTIYMTAIDMAERQGDYGEAQTLRERIASLPDADEQLLVTIVDYYTQRVQFEQAMEFIEHALEANPNRQKLLLRMGELLEEVNRPEAALTYYDQAVRLGARTSEGKEADKRLVRAVPAITDRERGSVVLALRETFGFVLFLLIMAWQDAGLNMLEMGLRRWVGVVLGFVGGYLLITATSSPQQTPIASWLGGDYPDEEGQPEPDKPYSKPGQAKQDPTGLRIISEDARYVLGFAGLVVLILAFWLVCHRSIDIVIDHPPPYMPWSNR